MGEFVGEAVGGGDDAEFFDAAPEGVGDGGIDGPPEGVRVCNLGFLTCLLLSRLRLKGRGRCRSGIRLGVRRRSGNDREKTRLRSSFSGLRLRFSSEKAIYPTFTSP